MDKKRLFRRVLSLFVSVAMVFVYIPQAAFADGPDGGGEERQTALFDFNGSIAVDEEGAFVFNGGKVKVYWSMDDSTQAQYIPAEGDKQDYGEPQQEEAPDNYQTRIPKGAVSVTFYFYPDEGYKPMIQVFDANNRYDGRVMEAVVNEGNDCLVEYELSAENVGTTQDFDGQVSFQPWFSESFDDHGDDGGNIFDINGWDEYNDGVFKFNGGQAYVMWNGEDIFKPQEKELSQPGEGTDESGEHFYQPGNCQTVMPDDVNYIELILIPDNNYEPKLRLYDAAHGGDYVDGIAYDEDFGAYVYKYEVTDEKIGINETQSTGRVGFNPEFMFEDSGNEAQEGTVLDLNNISQLGDGCIVLKQGGTMEVFFDNKKYYPDAQNELHPTYDDEGVWMGDSCHTIIPLGTKKIQIRLHPDDVHYTPKVRLFDAVKNGEYDDKVVYNEKLKCYVYEYELNEKTIGITEENPYGRVGFDCHFEFHPMTTLFGFYGLNDIPQGERLIFSKGSVELYWNGDTKYVASQNDFSERFVYDEEGNAYVDGYEHLMELPKDTGSIVMKVYPKTGYVPEFYVFDASTQSSDAKKLTGEYNEEGEYYEMVYEITEDCINNGDGSINGYIRISPDFIFDRTLAGNLSGKVYFDNSQVNWESVYVWAWSDEEEVWGQDNGFEQWPGIKLEKDEQTGYYYWFCEDLAGVNVMFNNAGMGAQTNDNAASDAKAGYVCKPTTLDNEGKYNAVWEKVASHKHTIVIDPAVEPTCTKTGKTQGSHCSECNEVIEKQEVIPAKGHDFEIVTTKAKPGADGSVVKKCKVKGCNHSEKVSTIYAPKTVKLSATSFTYDGNAKKPTVKSVKDSKNIDIDPKYYSVTYINNTKAGTATVKVTFKGDMYAGTLTKTFTIKKATNAIVGTTSYSKTTAAKAQTINLNMKATGGKITYKTDNNSVKVDSKGKVTVVGSFSGQAVITVTAGDSNYNTVTKKVTIKVMPVATTLKSVKNSTAKKDLKGKLTLLWNKLTYVTGYQIQYSTSATFASGNKMVPVKGASNVSKVITGLAKNKTYYVRVRTFKTVAGTNWYSNWSAKKSVKIGK